MSKIIELLKQRNATINKSEFLTDEFDYLLSCGLHGLAICLGGVVNSAIVTDKCIKNSIPVARLEAGIVGLNTLYIHEKNKYKDVRNKIAMIPKVVLLLTKTPALLNEFGAIVEGRDSIKINEFIVNQPQAVEYFSNNYLAKDDKKIR